MILGGASVSAALFVAVSLVRDNLPLAVRLALALTISLSALFTDWLPSARRQVDITVPRRGAGGWFQFGLEMGTGARTFSPTQLPHLVAAWAVIANSDLWIAIATGVAFGVGRAVALLYIVLASDPIKASQNLSNRRFDRAVVAACIGAVTMFATTLA